MKLAVVGVTGLVGGVMQEVLSERNFHIDEFIPVASARSVGKKINFQDKEYTIVSMEDAVSMAPDIAIFSAGGGTSLEWAPKFEEAGTIVIDNSSAWRMDPGKVLCVPEINADSLKGASKIIANPNCSTIQMVAALAPLHKQYGVNETQKILGDDSIKITATAVRVPVDGGHSESVNVQFKNKFDLAEVITLLEETDGIVVQNDIANNEYPMPLYAKHKDDVFVGRIRRDDSVQNGLNLWIVSDNLRKGAATNAVQIAEYLVSNNIVN